MIMAFFDIEPWEQKILKRSFSSQEALFFENSLTNENVIKAKDAEILGIFIYSPITEEILGKLPKLKLIVTFSTGYDHIDLAACKKRGIAVANVPTYGENTVAEHTFGLLLNLTRKIHLATMKTSKGDFSRKGLRGIDLKGKILGIVGLGHIGEHVARIAKGFEMKVKVHDPILQERKSEFPGVNFVGFDDLLRQSDVVSFHCPLNEKTKHLLNRKNLKFLKKGVFIINTARGPVVETAALLIGLKEGIIAGAGLDVLEEEQCVIQEEKELAWQGFNHECLRITLENHALMHHPNVIITPHNAFNSEEALMRILETSVENIQHFQEGKAFHRVS